MAIESNQTTKLLVFSPYYPPHIGGVENYAEELNKYLSLTGIDIIVFTPRLPEDAPEEDFSHGRIKIIRFPAWEIISNYPLPKFWSRHFWKLLKNLFNQNFDFILSHTRFFSTSLLALCFAKNKNVKWLHVEHGSSFVRLENKVIFFISRVYDLTLGKLVLRKADQIIAVSKSAKAFVATLAPKAKCQVIYRGFDQEEIENTAPDHKLKEKYKDSLLIIFIGRLISGKGTADLIRAIGALKERNILCLIIGDGPEKINLEILAADLDIEEKILFLGYKEHNEALALLKAADIFVNPSFTEGLPTTVIEAAFCHKAIIATNVGGTAEIISDGQSGILVDPKNPELLSEKITELLNNSQLRDKMGQNAFVTVKDKLNWEISVGKFIQLFNENQTDGK